MENSKRFDFIPAASLITPVPASEIAPDIQNELINRGGERLTPGHADINYPLVIFVLTGGTEKQILDIYEKRKSIYPNEPLILIAHNSNNSLPASLEALAKIHQLKGRGKIIYLDEQNLKQGFNELEKTIEYLSVYHKIRDTKIGLIGEPSDWLVASSPLPLIIEQKWGARVEKIPVENLIEGVGNVKDEEIEKECFDMINNAGDVVEPDAKELADVVRVYGALKKIVDKNRFNAVSVRCFDLVTSLKTTGCFALARLNDEGITAGCEGDLVSTLGMIWLNHFTGKEVWMANPARIDDAANSIWLAHCTVPVKMVSGYKLRSHFESGLGVGIQGKIENGDVTLVRLGGTGLEMLWAAEGKITGQGEEENLCRTQVRIKLDKPANAGDLLNNPLGNHILLVKGRYARQLEEWHSTFITV